MPGMARDIPMTEHAAEAKSSPFRTRHTSGIVLSLVCCVPFLALQDSHITPTLPSIAGRSSPSLPSSTLLFLLILSSFAAFVNGGFSCTNYPGGARHSSRPAPDPDCARVAVRLTFDDPDATEQSIRLAMTLFS